MYVYCNSLYLLQIEILEGNRRMSFHMSSLITHFSKVHHDVLSHASLSAFKFNTSEKKFNTKCFGSLWFRKNIYDVQKSLEYSCELACSYT